MKYQIHASNYFTLKGVPDAIVLDSGTGPFWSLILIKLQ